MSSLASVWSDFKETIFPTVAFADGEEKPHDLAAESKPDDKDEEREGSDSNDDEGESESSESEDKDDSENGGDDAEEGGDEESEGDDADEDEDDDDDEDEDDEDEVVDPLDALREKYTNTICHSFKHHFDECTERVMAAQEEEGYEDREDKEDCIEEFFHLQHCLNDHISPVLFSKLK